MSRGPGRGREGGAGSKGGRVPARGVLWPAKGQEAWEHNEPGPLTLSHGLFNSSGSKIESMCSSMVFARYGPQSKELGFSLLGRIFYLPPAWRFFSSEVCELCRITVFQCWWCTFFPLINPHPTSIQRSLLEQNYSRGIHLQKLHNSFVVAAKALFPSTFCHWSLVSDIPWTSLHEIPRTVSK